MKPELIITTLIVVGCVIGLAMLLKNLELFMVNEVESWYIAPPYVEYPSIMLTPFESKVQLSISVFVYER